MVPDPERGSYRIQGCCGTLRSAAAGELPSDPTGSDRPRCPCPTRTASRRARRRQGRFAPPPAVA